VTRRTKFTGATAIPPQRNLIRSKGVLPATGCPTAPPSPLQRHHRSTASPPRRQQPHGTSVYPAAVQLRKGEEAYPGSTVTDVHYDPNS